MTVILFSFDHPAEAEWTVVNDGVMGGRSAGFVAVEQGTLRFTGTLVTQGGGFTLVRARRLIDLTGQEGLALRVRGSGRRFEVEVDDGLRTAGRRVSRRAAFPTSPEWVWVRVPFSALRSTIFGRAVAAHRRRVLEVADAAREQDHALDGHLGRRRRGAQGGARRAGGDGQGGGERRGAQESGHRERAGEAGTSL
jgi:hypothetical protein